MYTLSLDEIEALARSSGLHPEAISELAVSGNVYFHDGALIVAGCHYDPVLQQGSVFCAYLDDIPLDDTRFRECMTTLGHHFQTDEPILIRIPEGTPTSVLRGCSGRLLASFLERDPRQNSDLCFLTEPSSQVAIRPAGPRDWPTVKTFLVRSFIDGYPTLHDGDWPRVADFVQSTLNATAPDLIDNVSTLVGTVEGHVAGHATWVGPCTDELYAYQFLELIDISIGIEYRNIGLFRLLEDAFCQQASRSNMRVLGSVNVAGQAEAASKVLDKLVQRGWTATYDIWRVPQTRCS